MIVRIRMVSIAVQNRAVFLKTSISSTILRITTHATVSDSPHGGKAP